MTTKRKIIIGFIVMIVLVAGMAVLGYVELEKASDGFTDYRRNARVNVAASDLETRLYRSVAKTYDYAATGETAKLDEALEQTDVFSALTKEAEGETDDQELKAIFEDLRKQAGTFKQAQEQVRDNTNALQKQYEQGVRPKYAAIIEKLNALAQAADSADNARVLFAVHEVWNDFSIALGHIGRFAQSGVPGEGEMAIRRIAAMQPTLERMGTRIQTQQGRALYAEVMAAYKTLSDTVNTMASSAQAMVGSLDRLHGVESGVAAAISSLNQKADADMRELGSRILANNDQAQSLLLLLSIGGLIVGVVLAAFIIVGIVRVLTDLSSFAAAVANGNFAYEPKTREQGEIGAVIDSMKHIPTVLNDIIGVARGLANDIGIGKLRSRGDASALPGAFVNLGNAINSIIDAYTKLIDALPMPVMACDKNNNVLFFNKIGQKVVGGEHLGAGCQGLLNAPQCGTEECLGKQCMNKGDDIVGETVVTPEGKKMDVSVTAFPLRDMTGEISGYVEILTDLSEIKQQQRTMLEVASRASEISNRVAAASEQLSAQVEQVSRGAEMQRERVESTASAMTEMNATVLEVARSAGQAAEQSDDTTQKAVQGAELVTKVIASINAVNAVGQKLRVNMEELGTQAESIGGVMNVISDIADQTNLLALNAAIEAARAGEAGRGFAVVADEVRKLAEKTMQATQEVGSSISAVQNSARINIEEVGKAVASVEEANGLANSSGEALSEIVKLASANSSVVASIATAAEQQSATSEEINSAIEEINHVVAETTEGMVQSSSAVQELSHTAQELRHVMESLR